MVGVQNQTGRADGVESFGMVIIYQTKDVKENAPHTWTNAVVQGSNRKGNDVVRIWT